MQRESSRPISSSLHMCFVCSFSGLEKSRRDNNNNLITRAYSTRLNGPILAAVLLRWESSPLVHLLLYLYVPCVLLHPVRNKKGRTVRCYLQELMARTNGCSFGSVHRKFKPHLLMVLAQLGYTALYFLTEASFNHGLNPHVYVTYRHVVAGVVIFPFAYFLERYINILSFTKNTVSV